jgi:hypothetical protein
MREREWGPSGKSALAARWRAAVRSQVPEREGPGKPIPAESNPERVRPTCLHRRHSAQLHPSVGLRHCLCGPIPC